MTTNNDVFRYLCELAPLSLQMDFDNSGFLLGRSDAAVKKVLLSLDVTEETAAEAEMLGATLIISHHPLIFEAIRSVTDSTLLYLAAQGASVISMHTNLDIAAGGVNDVLLSLFSDSAGAPLDEDGCGRVGELPREMPLHDFLLRCKELLNTSGLRYYDAGRPVKKLAVMGGAGGVSVERAAGLGCDTYLTADIKYNQFLLAKKLGLNLIDGDHFCTENPVILVLAQKLRERFPGVSFTVSAERQTVSFI